MNTPVGFFPDMPVFLHRQIASQASVARFSRAVLLVSVSCFALLLSAGCVLPEAKRFTPMERAVKLVGDGQEYEREGNLAAAERAYLGAIDISPRPAAYMGLVRVAMARGQFDVAEQYMVKLETEMGGERSVVLLRENLEVAKVATPEVEGGTRAWSVAEAPDGPVLPQPAIVEGREVLVEVDPMWERRMTVGRSRFLAEQEKPAYPTREAIDAVLFVAMPDPAARPADDFAAALGQTENPEFYLARGREAFGRRDYAQARMEFATALRLEPRNLEALVELGDVYEELGDSTHARRLYEQAAAIAPLDARAAYKLGNSFLRRGRASEAIRHYDRALELDGLHVFALHNRSVAQMEMRDIEAARAGFLRVIQLDPGYPRAYWNLGLIALEHDRNNAEAARLFREYLNRGGADRAGALAILASIEG
jgi:tetratricopeptide (TPR) repeat protein